MSDFDKRLKVELKKETSTSNTAKLKIDEERNKLIPRHIMATIKQMAEQQEAASSVFELEKDPIVLPPTNLDTLTENAKATLEQTTVKSEKCTFEPPKSETAQKDIHLEGAVTPESLALEKLKKISEISDELSAANEEQPRYAKVEEVIGLAAAKIARDVTANCVISVEKGSKESDNFNFLEVKVVIFRKIKRNQFDKVEYHTKMRRQVTGSVIPIKELLMEAINKKYIGKGDRVVCVSDESIGTGYKGLLFIFDVDKVFFNMSTYHLAEKISPEILEAIIDLALEIGNEGREGRHIGTAFIIGDKNEILQHCKQLIINPFASCPAEQRCITDPNLRETVKGFAQLDGVFIIDQDGTIMTAGTHININIDELDLSSLQGFGTRHRYSAALTKLTDAIAIVVSESGGTVRIFKNGKMIMRLP
jgi:DNA integrity scanning protein DisA with diadenylate cyclase activity